jgi:cytochrome c biogenesis protein CcdA/thiol-disulfide isomerase/thioredoxin
MLIPILAFVAGVLAIASPCILPVLPIVFAREGAQGARGRMAFLIGMALAFGVAASLAAVAGSWAIEASRYGRWIGLALLALFSAALIWPALAACLARPFVAIGSGIAEWSGAGAFLTGVATGLIWTPCAGPILGLVLTAAAIKGPGLGTTTAFIGFGLGAASAIGVVLVFGSRLSGSLRSWSARSERVRPLLGAALLAIVVAIGAGLDTRLAALPQVPAVAQIERSLVQAARAGVPSAEAQAAAPLRPSPLDVFRRSDPWLSGTQIDRTALRGKVVLVNFWTYSCINCLRALPHVRSWAAKYRDDGLVVIGVHTPEFAFEKDPANVRAALATLGISYPVVLDNGFDIWRAFQNEGWPALYVIDGNGQVRRRSLGEGDYAGTERAIVALLTETQRREAATRRDEPAMSAAGTQAPADFSTIGSPETYVGYEKAERFAATPTPVRDRVASYVAPASLPLNGWGLAGAWNVHPEYAELAQSSGAIEYRYRARDLHLVMAPSIAGRPIRFRVTIDGHAPGDDHGTDTDASGLGTITDAKLYQLVRQRGSAAARTVRIEFDAPGVRAYAFTFG